MNFKKINSITGWVVFAIASVVYLLTIEPTASFWDCGEFISTADKLEVGHPPGAPFFMLVARLFILLAGGNVEHVPTMVNAFSALCSGFTILLLFWTITHLGRKLIGVASENFTPVQTVSVIGAGIVGALAYTFSDTFWFSAVEGEVYAFSSLFTALVFWAVLRWEDEADRRYANRWLVLIAYLMGLSIGVHLLNLLAIPAIGLVYYHRKYKDNITPKGTMYALLISAAILLVILYGIVPGVIQIAVWFEIFFVKNIGLPMHTGLYLYVLLLAGGIVYGLYYSLRKKKLVLNTALLMVTLIIIGYGSYAALIIRSAAEPPMDQNNPQNLFNLQYYLNREQYGDRPLFVGPYYNTPYKYDSNGRAVAKRGEKYIIKNGKYETIPRNLGYEYEDGKTTIFPRMYSPDHEADYKHWAGIPATQAKDRLPTFGQNLRFFFSYQLGFMYGRYFLWNFVGRQNDIQGNGDIQNGNWLSGITPLDEARLGPQDLPESMQNNGRNTYFFLPLLLGLVGLFFQYHRNRPDFWTTMMLFFMTGIAIVLYLNQTPQQPRERDYAYAGSFYAFAIWIGLGVTAIIEALPEKLRNKYTAIVVTLALLLLVPGIMAKENWDDHDRSGRYTARDFAYNYLETCEPNAIIFTNGDNDTFPLWYAQEVEGIRTDVRVVNLSYLSADWYIQQMSRAAYESKPLPFSLKPDQYVEGTRDAVYIMNDPRFKDERFELKDVMRVVASEDPKHKLQVGPKDYIEYMPTNKLKITIDKQKVLSNGTVSLKDSASVVPAIEWDLNDTRGKPLDHIIKSSVMVLDMLANNNWERPIYFAETVSNEYFLNLSNYFQLDGLAFRLVPIKSPTAMGRIDSDILYYKMMNQFRWGNLADPKVYLDETNLRLISLFRRNFLQLTNVLMSEGKNDSVVKALDKAYEVIPDYKLALSSIDIYMAQQYFNAGAPEKGAALAEKIFTAFKKEYEYYDSFPPKFKRTVNDELEMRMQDLYHLCEIARMYKQDELLKSFRKQWNIMFPNETLESIWKGGLPDWDDEDSTNRIQVP